MSHQKIQFISKFIDLHHNIIGKLMGKGRPEKYNRITNQQKFMLRRLIVNEKQTVKQVKLALIQAAQAIKINYSTAKTIMFFFRKSSPDIPSLSQKSIDDQSATKLTTSTYRLSAKPSNVMICSSIGGGVLFSKNDSDLLDQTNQQNS